MAKIPTMDEMSKQLAQEALDNFLYDGKSLREWMRIIASEDAISRAEVIALYDEYRPKLATHVSEFGDKLKALPPIQPKAKVGKWKYYQNEKGDWINECSVCKCDAGVGYSYNYCPNCGAKMESEVEE